MKNRLFKGISLFLIIALLFSGCGKTKKEIAFETETLTVSDVKEPEENPETESGEKFQEQDNIVVEQKEEVFLEETQKNEEDKAEQEPALSVCSLIVQCNDILKNPEKLKEEKKSLIPENGIIYENNKVSFSKGESAFDILNRELIKNRIHFEFVNTPMYDSAYIEGIGNLYEFDCGSLSGWMYRVNGIKQNFGCSQYTVKDGDEIEFYYSCNFLEDNAKNS